jgi:putative spermidine/putrescine transport system permease protein
MMRGRDYWPVALLLGLLLAFYIAPLALFFGFSFVAFLQPGQFGTEPTLDTYARVFADTYTLGVFATTLRIGLIVTVLSVVIGYPVAHFIAREAGWRRRVVLLIVTASLFTNLIVRTYGWIVLLTPRGVLNAALMEAGLVERPLRLIFNEIGVVIGLTQIMLPLFILVAAVSISTIPRTLEEAAEITGAGPVRRFWKITLPLSLPGVVNGALLVFVLSVSNFITPDFLGGGRVLMAGSMIYQLVTRTLNYPFAAAVAVSMLVGAAMVVLAVLLVQRGWRSVRS